MRITFIATKLNLVDGGGESPDIFLQAKALGERGHKVRVVTVFSNSNKLNVALPFKLCQEYPPERIGLFGVQKFVVGLLKKYQADTDVFYALGSAFLFGAGWYRLFSQKGKPFVSHINGYTDYTWDYFQKPPFWPPVSRGFFRSLKHRMRIILERSVGSFLTNQIDKILVMNRTVAGYYIRSGVRDRPMVKLASFIDIESVLKLPISQDPFSEFPGKFNILSVGRLHLEKGADILIRAFSVAENRQKSILHIVGAGEELDNLKRQVRELGLESSVRFYPWQPIGKLATFFGNADLYVYPARAPGPFVRSTIEAMAFGLPLIVSDTGDEVWLPEVAKQFRFCDPNDLGKKIDEAFGDRRFLEQARRNGPKRALDLDYRNWVSLLEDSLSSVVKPKLN
jgi:glycosyltransferase involved in cell wall biosynthesis